MGVQKIQLRYFFKPFDFTCTSLWKLWVTTTKIAKSDGIDTKIAAQLSQKLQHLLPKVEPERKEDG